MSQTIKDLTIRLANKDETEEIVEIMAINFMDAEFTAWLAENVDERIKVLKDYFRLLIRVGLNKGTLNVADCEDLGVLGAAIWYPKGSMGEEENDEIMRFAGSHAPRFQMLGDTLEEHYPPAMYEHLALICVHPKAQGRGAGGKLISHRLNELDKIGMPAYLEATTRQSARGAYERAGFQPVGDPIRLPRGVQAFPMWRNPQTPGETPVAYTLEDEYDTGKVMQFGNNRWWVLNVQDGKALLLCDHVLEKHCYHDKYEAVTWADCSLRHYMNNEFYNTFSDADKSRILETKLLNMNNPWFGTNGGRDTEDKIFILSIHEVVTYLGNSGQLNNRNPDSKFFINDSYNGIRKAVSDDNLPSSWWLRTPGNNPNFASCVTVEGRIAVSGDFVNRDYFFVGGFRPAMWISL
ncbi:MAG: GNAT family N-acetyltransferase [Oscillospiraceae bacterium]|nr:GNAT family N-acetyltransferase [Oscillospiraceae bacterium]